MHVTQALLGIERILASQRMYQAAAVLSEAGKYITLLEGKLKDLAKQETLNRQEDAPAEAAE